MTGENIRSVLIIIMFILLLITAFLSFRYYVLYKEAIKQGAENTVTALEMVVACRQIGNVTDEQIKRQYLETFLQG